MEPLKDFTAGRGQALCRCALLCKDQCAEGTPLVITVWLLLKGFFWGGTIIYYNQWEPPTRADGHVCFPSEDRCTILV